MLQAHPSSTARSRWTRRFILTAAVLFLLTGAVRPAAACTGPPPVPPTVWVVFHTPTDVWIIFHNFNTFSAFPGQFCACGLKRVGPIQSINSAHLADANGNLVAGFSFAPNSTTGASFSAVDPTGGGGWGGFLAGISAFVPAGLEVNLMIGVTVAPGTTFNQLAQALANQGLVGTDEAFPDGRITKNHLAIVRPGVIMESSNAAVRATIGQIMRERSSRH